MGRIVPVVVAGNGAVADGFRALVAEHSNDIAGVEGLEFTETDELGATPCILVETTGDVANLLRAVRRGHAAVTSGLAALARDPVAFAVLRADRRLGLEAALLPGLPVASTLGRLRDSGARCISVEVEGSPMPTAVEEALAIAGILGVELPYDAARVEGAPDHGGAWVASIGRGRPVVRLIPALREAEIRTVTIAMAGAGAVTLSGPVGGAGRIAAALWADVRALAREADTPWRSHRRRAASLS